MLIFTLAAVVVVGATSVLVWLAYKRDWKWTGIPADIGDGTSVRPPRPGKTVWDWLQLLIVPLVVAVAAFALNAAQASRQRQQDQSRAEAERQRSEKNAREQARRAVENRRDEALRSYMLQMSQLMLDTNLGKPSRTAGAEGLLARTLTLTTLGQLDGRRKGTLVRFLVEAGLVTATGRWTYTPDNGSGGPDAVALTSWETETVPRVSLDGADLREVVLRGHYGYTAGTHIPADGSSMSGDLVFVDFSGADMRGADLRDTVLVADFEWADLRGADFADATLNSSRFRETCVGSARFTDATLGAFLPDGNERDDVTTTSFKIDGVPLPFTGEPPVVEFYRVEGHDVDFTGANLNGMDLGRGSGWGALAGVMVGAQIRGTRFSYGWTTNGAPKSKFAQQPCKDLRPRWARRAGG